jgi:hypothetical protein
MALAYKRREDSAIFEEPVVPREKLEEKLYSPVVHALKTMFDHSYCEQASITVENSVTITARNPVQ